MSGTTAIANSAFTWARQAKPRVFTLDEVRAATDPEPAPPPPPPDPNENPFAAAQRYAAKAPTTAAAPTTEESAMPPPKKPRKGRGTAGTSGRFQVCALLLARGELARSAITSHLTTITGSALSNGLFSAKRDGLIAINKDTGGFYLTEAGKAWVNGGANLDNHRVASAPAKKSARTKPTTTPPAAKPKRKAQKVPVSSIVSSKPAATAPAPTTRGTPTFRATLGSDDTFQIEKGGVEIKLDAIETRQMFAYLDRIAEASPA